MTEIKEAVDGLATSFEQFKATNDARLREIERRGAADPVTETKLAKIETSLSGFEARVQGAAEAARKADAAEAQVKRFQEIIDSIELKMQRPGTGGGANEADRLNAEYRPAFNLVMRRGEQGIGAAEQKAISEYKALWTGNDALGGYYLAPSAMESEIVKAVVLQSPMRALARVTTIGVATLRVPKRTGVFAAARVAELSTRSETTGYTTGMTEIAAAELFAEVDISTAQIEDSYFDMEAEMRLEFAEQFAVKEGAEHISGTGVGGQCEGVMTASGTNSVNSGNATNITADGVVKLCFEGIKTAYAQNAIWIANRKTIGAIRRLKDGDGSYLWSVGLPGSLPMTILGLPYSEMPDMPDEGAGLYPLALGDWKRAYRIADRVMMDVMVDRYSKSNVGQIVYRARKRTGGAVVLPEAIAKLKCST